MKPQWGIRISLLGLMTLACAQSFAQAPVTDDAELVAQFIEARQKIRANPGVDVYFYLGPWRVDRVLSLTEIAVTQPGNESLDIAAVDPLVPEGKAASAPEIRGVQLTLPANSDTAALQAAMNRLEAAGYSASGVLRAPVYIEGASQSREMISDRVLVRLNGDLAIQEIQQQYNASIEATIGPGLDVFVLRVPGGLLHAIDVANELHESGRVEFASPQLFFLADKRFLPNDTLFGNQWHLKNTAQNGFLTAGNDINVEGAWDSVNGTGVVIGVVDDGLEYTHEDLSANARTDIDFDFNFNDPDPAPGQSDFHGTAVGGVCAGRGNNAMGVSGVAFLAQLAGIRLIAAGFTQQQVYNALTHTMNEANAANRISVSNNSWGPSDDGATISSFGAMPLQALEDATALGRGGRGTIFAWAAGNGRCRADNANFDGLASSRFVINVAASGGRGENSWYSERGASLLVNAPSSSGSCTSGDTVATTTTDRMGSTGYASGNYTNSFNGTSSASPVVAGVAALLLDANPNLGWRDVQHILAETATKNDPTHSSWMVNGAGHDFSDTYGFGRVNAAAGVTAAQTWQNVPPSAPPLSNAKFNSPATAIPDGSATGVTQTLPINGPPNFVVEYVELIVSITHAFRGELQLDLTSPQGTMSTMASRRPLDGNTNLNWMMMTRACLDENPNGVWSLKVSDTIGGNTGQINSWSLIIHGYLRNVAGPALSVGPPNRNVGALAGSTTFDISNTGSSDLNWTATPDAGSPWLTIPARASGVNDGSFTANFASNVGASRVGIINLSAPGASGSPKQVTVTQAASTNLSPILDVNPPLRESTGAAGSVTFDVKNLGVNSMSWLAQVISGTWATIPSGSTGTNNGTVTVAFGQNNSGNSRTAVLRVSAAGAVGDPVEVSIVQHGATTPKLQVTPANQTVGASTGTTTLNVANIAFGTMNWNAFVNPGAPWLTIIGGGSGINSGTITLQFLQNPTTTDRSATVTVQAPGAIDSPATVTVTQSGNPNAGAVLEVQPRSRNVGFSAGSTSFIVSNTGTGNLHWEANASAGTPWITISAAKASGVNGGTIMVNYAANSESTSRSAVIEVKAPGAGNSPIMLALNQAACGPPGTPTGLTASNGAPGAVHLNWQAVADVSTYRIYRSLDPMGQGEALLVGTSTGAAFSDTSAAPPQNIGGTAGCPGGFASTQTTYFYWVEAVNACAVSGPSNVVTGSRGADTAKSLVGSVYARVLPGAISEDGYQLALEGSSLAVRLYAPTEIDPSSVWGSVFRGGMVSSAVDWRPAGINGAGGGWIVYVADSPFVTGEVITVTAGGASVEGQALESVTYQFVVGADSPRQPVYQPDYSEFDSRGLDLATESMAEAMVTRPEVEAMPPVLEQGVGGVLEIGPDGPFLTPQRIWAPVPAGYESTGLELHYYIPSGPDAGWYRADAVEGFLNTAQQFRVQINGVTYQSYVVNHSGVVQLAAATPASAASMAGALSTGSLSNLALFGVLLAVMLAIGWAHARRRNVIE